MQNIPESFKKGIPTLLPILDLIESQDGWGFDYYCNPIGEPYITVTTPDGEKVVMFPTTTQMHDFMPDRW